MVGKKFGLVRGIAATAVMFTSVLAAGGVTDAAPQRATFRLLTTQQSAAAQPTAVGQQILDLTTFEGKLYAGFGDYGANTGPIPLEGIDPVTGAQSREYVADTEAVYNFRVINGQMHVPSIDPRVSADYSRGGPWTSTASVGAYHVYDMATLTGTDLWMVGSKGYDAVAWRSLDGGATWTEALTVAPQRPDLGDYSRFYFAGVLNGKLYVQANDARYGAHPTSLAFDGSSWAPAASMISGREFGWKPVEFGGKLVFHANGHGAVAAIKAFDGTSVTVIASGYDVEVAGRQLYVLDDSGAIRSTRNLSRWTLEGTAPAGARSLAASDRQLFVGTATSEIWVTGR